MVPTLPFDDLGIILTTMTTTVTFLYFLVIVSLNLLGLLIADMEADKKVEQDPNINKDYEYEWREVGLYAIASAVLTMALLESLSPPFWQSLFFAFLMGLVFRVILPEITKLAVGKIKALIQVLFGKYE